MDNVAHEWDMRLTRIYAAGGDGWSNGYHEYLLSAEVRKGGIPGHVAYGIYSDYAARRGK